jgi:hypothetical protein
LKKQQKNQFHFTVIQDILKESVEDKYLPTFVEKHQRIIKHQKEDRIRGTHTAWNSFLRPSSLIE